MGEKKKFKITKGKLIFLGIFVMILGLFMTGTIYRMYRVIFLGDWGAISLSTSTASIGTALLMGGPWLIKIASHVG
jgi:ABC-type Co2+ transport system permease subunit